MLNSSIYTLYQKLYETYGQQGWWPLINYEQTEEKKQDNDLAYHIGDYSFPKTQLEVFEICLGAFLTQNTTFTSVVTSLQNLKSLDALSPEGIKSLDIEVFKLAIKPSGYYNQKAKYILGFITFFENLKGSTPTRKALLEVVGIGNETADSILLYAYNEKEFVIDTYTKRILISLELIHDKTSYMEIKMMMENALEDQTHKRERVIIYQEFHALIVKHAKSFYSKKPYGKGCLLQKA